MPGSIDGGASITAGLCHRWVTGTVPAGDQWTSYLKISTGAALQSILSTAKFFRGGGHSVTLLCECVIFTVATTWNERVPKIITDDTVNLFFKLQSSIISNHNGSRVLFDKNCFRIFNLKNRLYLYFGIGDGQPREPALCQLHSFTSPQNVIAKNRIETGHN